MFVNYTPYKKQDIKNQYTTEPTTDCLIYSGAFDENGLKIDIHSKFILDLINYKNSDEMYMLMEETYYVKNKVDKIITYKGFNGGVETIKKLNKN